MDAKKLSSIEGIRPMFLYKKFLYKKKERDPITESLSMI